MCYLNSSVSIVVSVVIVMMFVIMFVRCVVIIIFVGSCDVMLVIMCCLFLVC